MLLRMPPRGRWGNSLAGAIPAGIFMIATLGAFASGRIPDAVGGLTLVAAFAALALRCFRTRVETTVTTMTVYGIFRNRRINRSAITSIDEQWTSYAAVLAVMSGTTVPSIRWTDADGNARTTPISALATNYRGLGSLRRAAALELQRLEIWLNADERFVPQ